MYKPERLVWLLLLDTSRFNKVRNASEISGNNITYTSFIRTALKVIYLGIRVKYSKYLNTVVLLAICNA